MSVHHILQEVERVRWEEQRKAMQQDAQTKAEMSRYEDQLARARAADEHEKYRQRNAELVQLQEESAARQEGQKRVIAQQIEAERRATDQHRVCILFRSGLLTLICPFRHIYGKRWQWLNMKVRGCPAQQSHICLRQADLEKQVQREKALAEAEGRIKENRENEDVNRRQMLVRLEEERKKAIEAIEATFRYVLITGFAN